MVAGDVGHNVEEEEEVTDVAGDLGCNMEEEEEVTDGPLGPAVVGKAVESDRDATVLAVLPDTDGPSGPSVVDKVVEGDGDTTVLAVLPDIYGTDGPLGVIRHQHGIGRGWRHQTCGVGVGRHNL